MEPASPLQHTTTSTNLQITSSFLSSSSTSLSTTHYFTNVQESPVCSKQTDQLKKLVLDSGPNDTDLMEGINSHLLLC